MAEIVVVPQDTPPRAAVLLFHGGGLRRGTPADLAPHCRALAEHGILAVSGGYRLLDAGATSIDDCRADVESAVAAFVVTAAGYGLGAQDVMIGGSSAGAHLALVAAMTPGFSIPIGGVVALNPAGSALTSLPAGQQRELAADVGLPADRLREYSLRDLVRPGLPAVLIHHGTADEVERIDDVRDFRDVMVQAGNRCVLEEYPGERHAFHQPRPGGRFEQVMSDTAAFVLERESSC